MEASKHIKRQRSENWLEEDKVLLRELVRERAGILENKKVDTNTNAMKVEAWLELQNSFNCLCKGVQRTLTQLKGQHKMLKANGRKDINETGPIPPMAPTSETPESHSMISKFESDQTLPSAYVTVKEETNENGEILIQEVLAADSNLITPTQSTLKPTNPKFKRYRKNIFSAAERVNAIELQCRKELHKAQMKNEKLKAENLALKEVLLKTKIKFYQEKIKNNSYD